MKKTIILIPVFAIIVLFRVLCKDWDKTIYFIAGVNWASLLIIVACILEKVAKGIRKAYDSHPKSIGEKNINHILARYYIIPIVIIFIIGGIYFWLLCSNLANDILSIITIGIAVLDEEIIKLLLNFYK